MNSCVTILLFTSSHHQESSVTHSGIIIMHRHLSRETSTATRYITPPIAQATSLVMTGLPVGKDCSPQKRGEITFPLLGLRAHEAL